MQKRKDLKGRVLKDGESQRKNDGLYMYRWSDKNGKRHCMYSKSLDTLREKEDDLKKDVYDGIKVEAKNVTLNDVYDLWKHNKKGLKISTFGNYIYLYEHYIMNKIGTKKIQKIKRSDVMKLYNDLADNENISMNTIDGINTVIHQIFDVAVNDDYIRKNPSQGVFNECKKARNYKEPRRHALTIHEQKAFIDTMKKSNTFKHWLPIFTFLLGTGCRVSEAIGLTWDDVDFENNVIDINHGLICWNREKKKAEYYISETKTKAGTRKIPLLAEVKQALLDEKKYQKEVGISCNVSISGKNNFVFLNRFGNVHNSQTLNRNLKRIILNYNEKQAVKSLEKDEEVLYLPHFSCHNLRHTFCTRFCENETNIKVIQSIMGHSDIQTTMNIYAEVTGDKKAETFKNLEGKIFIS